MTKPTTVIFTEREPHLAAMLAQELRNPNKHVVLSMASKYITQTQDNEKVLIMPDVTPACRAAILGAYPNAEDVRPTPLASVSDEVQEQETNVVAIPVIPIRRSRGRPRKYPKEVVTE